MVVLIYSMNNMKSKILKYLKQTILIGLLGYLFIGLFLSKASAQEARVMTIVPPKVEQVLDRSGKAEGTMKVQNDSSQAITFKATIQDYVVLDKNGTPQLLSPNSLAEKYSASAWIGITPQTFTIPAHGKQSLNYFIQIPANASPGGHYAAAVFIPQNNPGSNSSGASIQTEIGSLFYISIKGPINEYAQVSNLFANPFQEYGPVKIIADIKNLGDLHIKPLGYISIYDTLGRSIKTLPLPSYNIFPTAEREYNVTLDSGFMVGRYKATLTASYGINGNLPLTKTIYFWVFPWKIAVVTILILIVIVLVVMLRMKKRKKTPPAKDPAIPEKETTPPSPAQ